jgi:cytidine deaminase
MTFLQYKEILRKKASKSISKFQISAIGLNSDGVCVAKSFNRPRFSRKGGGIHAEIQIMRVAAKKGIKTILICRINNSGNFLPIHPCCVCKKKAEELGIKIISII